MAIVNVETLCEELWPSLILDHFATNIVRQKYYNLFLALGDNLPFAANFGHH
jgi:hypothetical protein